MVRASEAAREASSRILRATMGDSAYRTFALSRLRLSVMRSGVLRRVAGGCSVLQCVAVCRMQNLYAFQPKALTHALRSSLLFLLSLFSLSLVHSFSSLFSFSFSYFSSLSLSLSISLSLSLSSFPGPSLSLCSPVPLLLPTLLLKQRVLAYSPKFSTYIQGGEEP